MKHMLLLLTSVLLAGQATLAAANCPGKLFNMEQDFAAAIAPDLHLAF